MRIIEPVEIIPSMAVMEAFLVEPNSEPLVVQVGQAFQVASLLTNVPEDDAGPWVPTVSYVVGDLVMLEHRIYEALVANTNKSPLSTPADPPKAAVLGEALYGTSVGITDYSRKERDTFGNMGIVERGYSKRADFDVIVQTSTVSQVQRLLSKYRAKPLVWIGEASFQSTILYGYYKEFNLVISGPTVSDCSISVEGLI
ncbi:TPA: hypothetical protein ACG3DQ_000770 [Pseudomonas putida]